MQEFMRLKYLSVTKIWSPNPRKSIDGNESPIQLSDFTYALTSRNPGKIRYFTDCYIKPE